jgi:hypothetical protein
MFSLYLLKVSRGGRVVDREPIEDSIRTVSEARELAEGCGVCGVFRICSCRESGRMATVETFRVGTYNN